MSALLPPPLLGPRKTGKSLSGLMMERDGVTECKLRHRE